MATGVATGLQTGSYAATAGAGVYRAVRTVALPVARITAHRVIGGAAAGLAIPVDGVMLAMYAIEMHNGNPDKVVDAIR